MSAEASQAAQRSEARPASSLATLDGHPPPARSANRNHEHVEA